MKHTTSHKITNILQSEVINILHSKGFSFLFNDNDFTDFCKLTARAFNKAHSIADMFIQDAGNDTGDFSSYIF